MCTISVYQVKEILQEEEDLSEIVQLVGKVIYVAHSCQMKVKQTNNTLSGKKFPHTTYVKK